MIYYNGCGCLKTEFFILGAVFLFWGLHTHSVNKYLSQRLCGSWSLQDPTLWRGYCSATNPWLCLFSQEGWQHSAGTRSSVCYSQAVPITPSSCGTSVEEKGRPSNSKDTSKAVDWCSRGVFLNRLHTKAYGRMLGAFTLEGAWQEHSNRLFDSVSTKAASSHWGPNASECTQ